MNEIAYGAFVGTSSVLIAMYWLWKIDVHNRHTEPLREELLKPSPAYKGFTLVVAALTIISTFAILSRDSSDTLENVIFYSFIIAAIVLAGRMMLESFFVLASFDENGIASSSRFGGNTTIFWRDIKSVKLDTIFNVFVISTETQKIRLSRYCIGIYVLLEEIRVKAPSTSTNFVSKYLIEHPTDM
ncbi:MAG: hypothetical protein ACI9UN_005210 [Granulosicoccus sp.]|jgi:hypothetical protein